MEKPGDAILRRALERVVDHDKSALTAAKLLERCRSDVCWRGREGETDLVLKGSIGKRMRTTRRLFPGGPKGIVAFPRHDGTLYLRFNSLEVMLALGAASEASSALLASMNDRFPHDLPIDRLGEFKQCVTPLDLPDNLLRKVYADSRGMTLAVCRSLLVIEAVARQEGWRTVTAEKWGNRWMF